MDLQKSQIFQVASRPQAAAPGSSQNLVILLPPAFPAVAPLSQPLYLKPSSHPRVAGPLCHRWAACKPITQVSAQEVTLQGALPRPPFLKCPSLCPGIPELPYHHLFSPKHLEYDVFLLTVSPHWSRITRGMTGSHQEPDEQTKGRPSPTCTERPCPTCPSAHDRSQERCQPHVQSESSSAHPMRSQFLPGCGWAASQSSDDKYFGSSSNAYADCLHFVYT